MAVYALYNNTASTISFGSTSINASASSVVYNSSTKVMASVDDIYASLQSSTGLNYLLASNQLIFTVDAVQQPASAFYAFWSSFYGYQVVASSSPQTPDNEISVVESANMFFASPVSGAGSPNFRLIVASDIPSLASIYLPLVGGTLTGKLNLSSSTSSFSSLNLPNGTSPSSPTTGDIWASSGSVFYYTGSASVQLMTSQNINGSVNALSKFTAANSVASSLLTDTGTQLSYNGNFTVTSAGTLSAGTVPVARVSGLATSATVDTTNASNITTGTLSSSVLPASGVTAATYGSGTQIPVITVDAYGRITSASTQSITMAGTFVPIAGGTMTGSLVVGSGAKISIISSSTTGSILTQQVTGNGTDANIWDSYVNASVLQFRIVNDAYSATSTWMSVTRSGAVISSIALAVRPTFNGYTPYDTGNLTNASSSTSGILTSADWNTFNNKISGNQTITLTGDASGSGTTSISVTNNLITVNEFSANDTAWPVVWDNTSKGLHHTASKLTWQALSGILNTPTLKATIVKATGQVRLDGAKSDSIGAGAYYGIYDTTTYAHFWQIRANGDLGLYSTSNSGTSYVNPIIVSPTGSISVLGSLAASYFQSTATNAGANGYLLDSTYGTSGIYLGNGDSATYSTYNMKIKSWFGIGFESYDNITRTVLNTRTGNFSTLGTIAAASFTENSTPLSSKYHPLENQRVSSSSDVSFNTINNTFMYNGVQTMAAGSTYQGYWFSILTLSITAQYGASSASFSISNTYNTGASTNFYELNGSIKIRQQSAMTNTLDMCALTVEGFTGSFSTSYIRAVLTTDTSANKVVTLYAYSQWLYDSVVLSISGAAGAVSKTLTFSGTSLPAGTQYSPMTRMSQDYTGNVAFYNNVYLVNSSNLSVAGNASVAGTLSWSGGIWRDYTGSASYTMAYGVNAGTPGGTNYSLGFAKDGSYAWLNGTTVDISNASDVGFRVHASGITVFRNNTYLNNATSNLIAYNNVGVAAPTQSTRSAGTKIVLFPAISASQVDYAIGIEGSTLWSSIPNSTCFFKWYSNTAGIMTLDGSGNLNVAGNISKTGGTAYQFLKANGTTYTSANSNGVSRLYRNDASYTSTYYIYHTWEAVNPNGGNTWRIRAANDGSDSETGITTTMVDYASLAVNAQQLGGVAAAGYLPLTAGSGKALTGDLYTQNVIVGTSKVLGFFQSSFNMKSDASGNVIMTQDYSRSVSITYSTSSTQYVFSSSNFTVTSPILPSSSGTVALGSSSLRWGTLYATTLNVTSMTSGSNSFSIGSNGLVVDNTACIQLWQNSTFAAFGHATQLAANVNNYAVLADTSNNVYVNAGSTLRFRIANAEKMTMSSTLFSIATKLAFTSGSSNTYYIETSASTNTITAPSQAGELRIMSNQSGAPVSLSLTASGCTFTGRTEAGTRFNGATHLTIRGNDPIFLFAINSTIWHVISNTGVTAAS